MGTGLYLSVPCASDVIGHPVTVTPSSIQSPATRYFILQVQGWQTARFLEHCSSYLSLLVGVTKEL